jgi:hypothetical protein
VQDNIEEKGQKSADRADITRNARKYRLSNLVAIYYSYYREINTT